MNFDAITLERGDHKSPEDGLCAMEAVAWLEGLTHSDRPGCTCPVITEFMHGLNDGFDTETRQALIPYLPKLVGTVSPEHERARAEYLVWEAVTKAAPLMLEHLGMDSYRKRLNAIQKHDFEEARFILNQTEAEVEREQSYRADHLCLYDTKRAANWVTFGWADDNRAKAASYVANAVTGPGHPHRSPVWDTINRLAFDLLDGVLQIGNEPVTKISKPELMGA